MQRIAFLPFAACLAVAEKTDVYVVLRMDDIAPGWLQETQASVINWAIENKVKFNFGVITSDWPVDCEQKPGDEGCQDEAVKALQDAYSNGHVVGNSDDPIIEISNHAWGHDEWSDQWSDWETPKDSFDAWQMKDMQKSSAVLRQAFPKAAVEVFIAPTCRATAGTLTAMKAVNMTMISAQGQLGCDPDSGSVYNYEYAPCENQKPNGTIVAECVPPGDIYYTAEGLQALSDGGFSVPGGSANSNLDDVSKGLSVMHTLGIDESGHLQCGCNGDESCPIISSAQENSRKSGGLWWTVVMMHPETKFPLFQTYVKWLDELLAKSQELDDYEIHFINFQDLLILKSPDASAVTV